MLISHLQGRIAAAPQRLSLCQDFSVCWLAAVELAAAGARCRHNLFFGETAIDRASLCRIGGEFLSTLGWAVSDRKIVSNYLKRNLEWWKRPPGRLVFWL